MRTTDTTFKTNYIQNNPNSPNQQAAVENENSDSISQRDTDNSDIFDNFSLCQKFGQSNIEKGIFLLIIITFVSGVILHYNLKILKSIYIKLLSISSIIDLLLLLVYCFLRIKFSADQWFNPFPILLFNYSDYVIILNFGLKIAIFVLSFFYTKSLLLLLLSAFKFLLELYFLLSCVKFLVFCPGYKTFQECCDCIVGKIKKSFNCCENEHEGNEYRRIDESTNYDINYGNENEIQFA